MFRDCHSYKLNEKHMAKKNVTRAGAIVAEDL